MRDQLNLARHQQLTTQRTHGTTTTSQSQAPPPHDPPPPLLYQLQKGVRPRQPAASTTRAHPTTSTPPPPVMKMKLQPQPVHTAAKKARTPIVSADACTQTLVPDLPPHAFTDPCCRRCVCCELATSQQDGLVTARDEWRLRYESALDANRRLETEVSQLVSKLRSRRAELQTSATHTPVSKSIAPSRSTVIDQAAEQSQVIRLLHQQRAVDQQLIERLHLQIHQLQRPAISLSSPAAPPGTVSSSTTDVAGLSALQRHQLEIRSSAEHALLRLQALFPNQPIGL
jgi:hypothetical protein